MTADKRKLARDIEAWEEAESRRMFAEFREESAKDLEREALQDW